MKKKARSSPTNDSEIEFSVKSVRSIITNDGSVFVPEQEIPLAIQKYRAELWEKVRDVIKKKKESGQKLSDEYCRGFNEALQILK